MQLHVQIIRIKGQFDQTTDLGKDGFKGEGPKGLSIIFIYLPNSLESVRGVKHRATVMQVP